jgi:GNAT superfamily N-acetyltransferase
MVVIRQAQIEDMNSIIDMYDELYVYLMHSGVHYKPDMEQMKNSLLSQIQSKFFCVLMAEHNGEAAGFINACLRRMDRRLKRSVIGTINDVYVYPSRRGNAVGTLLVREAELWMRRNGAQSVQCDIVAGNTEGLNFWHKHGYVDAIISAQKSLEEYK